MAFLPYQDAMMGRPWTVNGQVNPISSMTTTGIPLAGPYRSGMMDWRESERHRDLLKQQNAAFDSPTGLNSHREMYFGEAAKTPVLDTRGSGYIYIDEGIQKARRSIMETARICKEEMDRNIEACKRRTREIKARESERMSDIMRAARERNARLADNPKSSWGPTIDYGNGLWEKRNECRDETLIGYTPYGSHTHTGPGFVSVRDHKTGKGIHWNLE